jgi:hypothetical protein
VLARSLACCLGQVPYTGALFETLLGLDGGPESDVHLPGALADSLVRRRRGRGVLVGGPF